MADHEVSGWSNPAPGVRQPVDLPVGTLAGQDMDAVAITGGSVSGATVAVYPRSTGVSAAGTNQGTATLINGSGIVAVSTVASGTGARFPAWVAGLAAYVFNGGANAMLLYPATGGQIDALGANVGLSVPAGKGAIVMPVSATQAYSIVGA